MTRFLALALVIAACSHGHPSAQAASIGAYSISVGGLADCRTAGSGGLNCDGHTYSQALTVISDVVGGGYVRTDLKWNEAAFQSNPGDLFKKYDAFVSAVSADGLRWMPSLHLVVTGGGSYACPSSWPLWESQVRTIAAHYRSLGVTQFEIWNEPNTKTGNGAGASGSNACPQQGGKMAPQEASNILLYGAMGLNGAGADVGLPITAVGMGFGTVDLAYLNSMNALDSVTSRVSGISVHVYPTAPPTSPSGSNACGVPSASYNPRKVTALGDLRCWLNSHGGSSEPILLSEGGYAGEGDTTCMIGDFSETDQATRNKTMIDTINTNNRSTSPWNVAFFSTYGVFDADNPSCSKTQDYAPIHHDGTRKPWYTT